MTRSRSPTSWRSAGITEPMKHCTGSPTWEDIKTLTVKIPEWSSDSGSQETLTKSNRSVRGSCRPGPLPCLRVDTCSLSTGCTHCTSLVPYGPSSGSLPFLGSLLRRGDKTQRRSPPTAGRVMHPNRIQKEWNGIWDTQERWHRERVWEADFPG